MDIVHHSGGGGSLPSLFSAYSIATIMYHNRRSRLIPLQNQLPLFLTQQLPFLQQLPRGRPTTSIGRHHPADNRLKIKGRIWHGQEGAVAHVLPLATIFGEGLGTAAEADFVNGDGGAEGEDVALFLCISRNSDRQRRWK